MKDFEKKIREMKKQLNRTKQVKAPMGPSKWKMFNKLWGAVSQDCRTALFAELISAWLFNDNALKCRYNNEIIFQNQINSHWK